MAAPHDSWAAVYDAVYEAEFSSLYRALTDQTLSILRQEIPVGSSIVGFGAGTGRLAILLAASGYRVTAVDASAAMLERLRKKRTVAGHTLPLHRREF